MIHLESQAVSSHSAPDIKPSQNRRDAQGHGNPSAIMPFGMPHSQSEKSCISSALSPLPSMASRFDLKPIHFPTVPAFQQKTNTFFCWSQDFWGFQWFPEPIIGMARFTNLASFYLPHQLYVGTMICRSRYPEILEIVKSLPWSTGGSQKVQER